jgi:hypothetical protein
MAVWSICQRTFFFKIIVEAELVSACYIGRTLGPPLQTITV